MRTLLSILGLTSLIASGVVSAAPEVSTEDLFYNWKNKDGKVIRGRFISLGEDTVTLMLGNNETREIPLRLCSPESLDQAEELAAKKGDESIQDVRQMIFVPIRHGYFTMGSPIKELGRLSLPTQATEPAAAAAAAAATPVKEVEPEHKVTLSQDFWMKQTEVTWDEWNAVMKHADGYKYSDIGKGRCGSGEGLPGTHPVTGITWYDAVKWCNLKSEIEGLTPAYYIAPRFEPKDILLTGNPEPFVRWDAAGYRLPTEAEWEYACRNGRSGRTQAFHSGNITQTGFEPKDTGLSKVAWYGGNSGGSTHPVGLLTPNSYGLHDMHGNAAEWCWDFEGYLSEEDVEDPRGGATGDFRIFRGGSWADPARCCRAAYRGYLSPVAPSSELIGFRPVRGSDGRADDKGNSRK